MKPDWKDAPEWAQWVAHDANGDWWWFEVEPTAGHVIFHVPKGRYEYVKPNEANEWKASKESRP